MSCFAPFLWFVIDRGRSAVQSADHIAACAYCRDADVPAPKGKGGHG